MLKRAGADHLMMLDPHSPQLEGFFDHPVDCLKVFEVLSKIILHLQQLSGGATFLQLDQAQHFQLAGLHRRFSG